MRKITKIMAVVLSVVCIFSMFAIGVNAAEKDYVCSIKLESSKTNPKPGDSFVVTVSAKTNYPVVNVNTIIAYDTNYYAVDTSDGAAVKKATKMPVALNQNVKSPLSMYHQSYSADMVKQYKLVFASVTWKPSLAPQGTATPTTTLTDYEPLFTIKFKMKSNAPTDGNGFLGIDPVYVRTETSTMVSGVYAARGGKTLGDTDAIVSTGQTMDLSQAVLKGFGVEVSEADEALAMNYKSTIDVSTLVDNPKNYTVQSSDISVVEVEEGKITAKKTGTAYLTVTSTDGKTRTNYEITVSYAWWQWIIIVIFFGWIWY